MLFKPFQRQRTRNARIRSITGKPPNYISRQLNEAQQMLDAAGMGEQANTYRWLAFILAMLGLAFGLIIENQLQIFRDQDDRLIIRL